ncbi:MAG: hypothetical protein QM692_19740 [Thermomicrobiales bacterium]
MAAIAACHGSASVSTSNRPKSLREIGCTRIICLQFTPPDDLDLKLLKIPAVALALHGQLDPHIAVQLGLNLDAIPFGQIQVPDDEGRPALQDAHIRRAGGVAEDDGEKAACWRPGVIGPEHHLQVEIAGGERRGTAYVQIHRPGQVAQ